MTKHTFLILIAALRFGPGRNDAAFLSRKARRSLTPPSGLLDALLSFKPPTRSSVKPVISRDRVLGVLPEEAFEMRDARDAAVPLLRCFRTFCAFLEGPPRAEVRVLDRVVVGSAAAGFLARRPALSMSISPSPSTRPALRFWIPPRVVVADLRAFRASRPLVF